jgi:hypothetical protein
MEVDPMKVYVMDEDGEEIHLADIDDEDLADWVETVRFWALSPPGTDPKSSIGMDYEGPHRVELRYRQAEVVRAAGGVMSAQDTGASSATTASSGGTPTAMRSGRNATQGTPGPSCRRQATHRRRIVAEPWVYCWVCDENHEGPECSYYDPWWDEDDECDTCGGTGLEVDSLDDLERRVCMDCTPAYSAPYFPGGEAP